MTINNTLIKLLPLTAIVFGLVGYNVMSAQWSGPTAVAPNNNTDKPINVGTDYQRKLGDLGAVRMRAGQYCNADGTICVDGDNIGGNKYIETIRNISGVTVPTPPTGVSDWPDYLICQATVIVGGQWQYIVVPLVHFNNVTKEFYYYSSLGNITFNQTGNVANSAGGLHATCRSAASNLAGLCSAGFCGYN